MAFTGNVAWYISTNKYSAVTQWATGAAKSVGDIIRQNTAPSAGNQRCFVCIVAGTTHATTEPTWTVTRGAKNTDNTVTWQECTGVAALNGDMTNTPIWTTVKNTSISLGHVIKSNDGTKILICTTAGTAGNGSEPSWSATPGNTTADNTATWTTLKASSNVFANWAAPFNRIADAQVTNWGDLAGSQYYVGNSHNYTFTASYAWGARGTAAAPVSLYCVSESGSMPPVSADLTTGAIEQGSGGVTFGVGTSFWKVVYGMTCKSGTSGTVNLRLTSGNVDCNFENCTFEIQAGAGSGSFIAFLNSSRGRCTLKDCTVKYNNAGQTMITGGYAEIINLTIDVTAVTPTNVIAHSGDAGSAIFKNCDFSNMGSTNMVQFANAVQCNIYFIDCKLPPTHTKVTNQTTMNQDSSCAIFLRCGSSAVDYENSLYEMAGQLVVDTTVVRHGGAQTSGLTQYSWKMTTTANAHFEQPLRSFDFGAYNSATATDVDFTVFGVINAASLPTNAEVWTTVDYLGSSSGLNGSRKSTRVADFLASAASVTADTSDWDDAAPARQNTHTYSVGDVISVASNPGRVFFCTTAGQSNGSEPVGYASAVDGGSVTDNAAVFRAGCRFKLTGTLTSPQPGLAEYVFAGVFVALTSSTQVYIDPTLVLS